MTNDSRELTLQEFRMLPIKPDIYSLPFAAHLTFLEAHEKELSETAELFVGSCAKVHLFQEEHKVRA